MALKDTQLTEDDQDAEEKRRIQQGTGETATGAPSTTLTEAEKERARKEISERERQRDTLSATFDRSGQPNYNNTGALPATADARKAPVVSASAPITAAQAAGPERIGSNINTADAEEARRRHQAYLDRLTEISEGRDAPSAAEFQMQKGNAAATAQAYSLAATRKGYSGAAARNAQRVGAEMAQQNVLDTGILRAKEMESARAQLGQEITAGRGQDIGLALGAGAQGLEAARANQAAKLSTDLQNAGFSQQAILQMSDQDLKTKLANAGFQLTQQQLDDVREHNRADIALRQRQLQFAYDQAASQNNRQDMNAILGMASSLGMILATASDERVKEDIQPMSHGDAKEFLDVLSDGYSYRYKPGEGPSGEHFGPMAQGLERSRIGRSLVMENGRGVKTIDNGRLVLALASALASAQKRRGA